MSIKPFLLNSANVSVAQPNVMILNFPQKLTIQPDEEVALASCQIPYSWKNITSQFNNQSVSYYWASDGSTNLVTFANVFFTTADICNYIRQIMVSNGHYLINSSGQNVYYFNLQSNYTIYGNTLTMTPLPSSLPVGWSYPSNWVGTLSVPHAVTPQLITGTNNFGALIGFANSTSFPSTPQTTTQLINSTLIPQLNPVIGCYITTNICNNPDTNTFGDVIYSFAPSVTFGQTINIVPPQLIFYKATSGFYSQLQVSFTDANHNPLGILDNNIIVSLLVRKKPSI